MNNVERSIDYSNMIELHVVDEDNITTKAYIISYIDTKLCMYRRRVRKKKWGVGAKGRRSAM